MDRATFLARLHARFELPSATVHDLVGRATGLRIAEVQRLVRGDENEVYRAALVTGKIVYVRACFPDTAPGKAGREAEMMERAQAAGVPVPQVLLVENVASEQGDRQAMVTEAAQGVQLCSALPTLSAMERTTVMRNIGHLLGRLSAVRMPGFGRPDEHGRWPDPDQDRRRYLTTVRAGSRQLDQVGLTRSEIGEIGRILEGIGAIPIADPPVLCHNDISAEHLFIDADQNITALIDWGMWSGGSNADDLATISNNFKEDFETIFAHHPAAAHGAMRLRQKMAVPLLTRGIGGLTWLIRSGQSDGREQLVDGVRRAVEILRPTGE